NVAARVDPPVHQPVSVEVSLRVPPDAVERVLVVHVHGEEHAVRDALRDRVVVELGALHAQRAVATIDDDPLLVDFPADASVFAVALRGIDARARQPVLGKGVIGATARWGGRSRSAHVVGSSRGSRCAGTPARARGSARATHARRAAGSAAGACAAAALAGPSLTGTGSSSAARAPEARRAAAGRRSAAVVGARRNRRPARGARARVRAPASACDPVVNERLTTGAGVTSGEQRRKCKGNRHGYDGGGGTQGTPGSHRFFFPRSEVILLRLFSHGSAHSGAGKDSRPPLPENHRLDASGWVTF